MTKTVGAFEAKTKLSALLDAVEKGEEFVISRNGVPVARLIAYGSERSTAEREAVIRRIQERAKGLTLGGISWKQLRDAGRKY